MVKARELEAERQPYSTIYRYGGMEWPPGLKTAAELAKKMPVSAERLTELAGLGLIPHWRVDDGPPLFNLTEAKTWCAQNILNRCDGATPPYQVQILPQGEIVDTPPECLRRVDRLCQFPTDHSSGVYFLVDGDEVVYVGQSLYPASRIAQHVQDEDKEFDRAYVLPVPKQDLNGVEGALIRAMRPRLNGNNCPYGDDVALRRWASGVAIDGAMTGSAR